MLFYYSKGYNLLHSSDNITLNQCTNYSDKTHTQKKIILILLSTKPRILNKIISCFDDIQSFCINYLSLIKQYNKYK